MNQLVVIGASAGGIDTLRQLVSALPSDFPAPICIVLHISPQAPGLLDDILSRSGPLTAVSARSGQRLRPGTIYVAPPDYHLVVEPGIVRVTKGPRENRFRPAIDPLFRSAAQVYGPRAIGVILTGNLDDGTAGLWAIKQLGGTTVAQDPADALFPSMPSSAIRHVKVDHVVPLAELAALLVHVTSPVAEDAPSEVPASRLLEVEVKIANEENPLELGLESVGEPSSYACPECHGVLLSIKEGERVRFRCHTGHAYSVASLMAAVAQGIEDSLWNAIRALEEGGMLMRRMAAHLAQGHDGDDDSRQLLERAEEAHQHANDLRTLVTSEREPLAERR